MKIAVPTDDGKRIAEHFGRAQSFVIFEVNNGEVISKEIIESDAPHARGEHGQGRGWFMDGLSGCEVVIAAGMGRRAIAHFQEAGIKPIFTDVTDAEQAVKAYAQGNLETCDQPDCGKH